MNKNGMNGKFSIITGAGAFKQAQTADLIKVRNGKVKNLYYEY